MSFLNVCAKMFSSCQQPIGSTYLSANLWVFPNFGQVAFSTAKLHVGLSYGVRVTLEQVRRDEP